jgi:hypothetical protein
MPDMIKVRTVAGRLCPVENGRGHVGHRQVALADESADHVIKGVCGLKRSTDVVEVPNTVYYRRAIECGDLDRADEAAPKGARSTKNEV